MRRQRLYDRPRSPAPPPNPEAVLPENTPLFEPNLQVVFPNIMKSILAAINIDTAQSSPTNDQIDLPDGFQQGSPSPLNSPTANTFQYSKTLTSPKRTKIEDNRSLLIHDTPPDESF